MSESSSRKNDDRSLRDGLFFYAEVEGGLAIVGVDWDEFPDDGVLVIPGEFDGKRVVEIGEGVFALDGHIRPCLKKEK